MLIWYVFMAKKINGELEISYKNVSGGAAHESESLLDWDEETGSYFPACHSVAVLPRYQVMQPFWAASSSINGLGKSIISKFPQSFQIMNLHFLEKCFQHTTIKRKKPSYIKKRRRNWVTISIERAINAISILKTQWQYFLNNDSY